MDVQGERISLVMDAMEAISKLTYGEFQSVASAAEQVFHQQASNQVKVELDDLLGLASCKMGFNEYWRRLVESRNSGCHNQCHHAERE